jgi:hypothetical protein
MVSPEYFGGRLLIEMPVIAILSSFPFTGLECVSRMLEGGHIRWLAKEGFSETEGIQSEISAGTLVTLAPRSAGLGTFATAFLGQGFRVAAG